MRTEGVPARLLIADDHALAREGLRSMLANEPDLQIVGEAKDGEEALNLSRRFRPELVLMDVRMPKMDGLEATRAIKEVSPQTAILIVTTYESQEYLVEAIKAGAAGYILKDASHEEIIEAVRRVRNGESPLDPELAARLLRRLASEGEARRGTGGPHAAPNAVEPLTPRELEVLGLMKLGRTNREIAGDLVISLGTAKNHVEHIISKLGVSDRTRAVVQGLELGLIDLP